MTLIERLEAWQEAQFYLAAGKKTRSPGSIRFLRPGEQLPERKLERDPRVIAAWLATHVGGR